MKLFATIYCLLLVSFSCPQTPIKICSTANQIQVGVYDTLKLSWTLGRYSQCDYTIELRDSLLSVAGSKYTLISYDKDGELWDNTLAVWYAEDSSKTLYSIFVNKYSNGAITVTLMNHKQISFVRYVLEERNKFTKE